MDRRRRRIDIHGARWRATTVETTAVHHDTTITVRDGRVASAEATMWSCGPLGVLVGGDDGATTLTASFDGAAPARRCAALLGEGASVARSPVVDWSAIHGGPVTVTVGGETLVLDVGATFGWGGHPSTRLLLDWLTVNPPTGLHVLDIGTGSGVLAIAAARLGAASVTAIDVDAGAIGVAAANADANGVAATVNVSGASLGSVQGAFDLVLANLQASTIIERRHDLLRASGGGSLAVSGMLSDRQRAVATALAPAEVLERLELDGWAALVLA